jgi:hypothetical protein
LKPLRNSRRKPRRKRNVYVLKILKSALMAIRAQIRVQKKMTKEKMMIELF